MRASTPSLSRSTSDGRPASRERSSEAGPARRARSVTSVGVDGRTRSPAERAEAWRDLSRSESPASRAREDLPSPPIPENTASPFDFDKYYASIASPAPHLPSVLGEAVGNPSAPFTENELALLRAYPPPPQDNYDGSMDWTGLENIVPPPLAPPAFPSPLSQAPMVSLRRLSLLSYIADSLALYNRHTASSCAVTVTAAALSRHLRTSLSLEGKRRRAVEQQVQRVGLGRTSCDSGWGAGVVANILRRYAYHDVGPSRAQARSVASPRISCSSPALAN